jgi:sugar lactone lactonase YvrE
MDHRTRWLLACIIYIASCDGTARRQCRPAPSRNPAAARALTVASDGGSPIAPEGGAHDDATIRDVGTDCVEAAYGKQENAIALENLLPGTSAWRLTQAAQHREIEGYASAVSVAPGGTVTLFVSVSAPQDAHWELYRLGYYGGLGGRFVNSGLLPALSPQPDCPASNDTGLVECKWKPSATLTFDSKAVTGYYVFKLIRDDGADSYVPIVVREPTPRAPMLVQASVTTWQAYNAWGGTSLYVNQLPSDHPFTARHAYQVSFDRPYLTTGPAAAGSGDLMAYEVWMLQWLESRGYDLAYTTNLDVDEHPDVLNGRKLFLDVGHDEYWSIGERAALDSARDHAVSLAFFSGNSGYWRIRLEPSSTGADRRMITCYKDASIDPKGDSADTTAQYRQSPHAHPENALIGQMYELFTRVDGFPLVVTNPSHWLYAGTRVTAGDTLSHVVGDEWDHVWDNGETPAGLEVLAHSDAFGVYGSDVPSDVTVYYPTPSSFVFSAGTRQWVWGLNRPGYQDPRIEQMTENVLSRAGMLAATSKQLESALTSRDVGTMARVSVVAGTGSPGFLDGKVGDALFEAPSGVAAAPDGVLYVTDTRNHRVRKIDLDGTVTTFAGSGATGITTSPRFKNGPSDKAAFSVPTGIVVGPDGVVYVSDSHNNRIRAISKHGDVTTFAGTGETGSADSKNPLDATFAYPRGLAFGPDGALYVADAYNSAIRRVGTDGVTTVAATPGEVTAVAFGADGTLYALTTNGSVSTVTGGKLVPFVDVDGVAGDAIGPGADARMRPADGLVVDGQSLIVSDSANYKVRRIALDGDHAVTTLVGDGRAGVDTGTGATTHVVNPRGIAITASGYIVADSGNHRLLRIER